MRWLKANRPALYRAIRSRFSSVAAARLEAGIPPADTQQRRWSQARIINELRQIHRAGRVRITASGLRAAGHKALLTAIYGIVGSIGRARRLARIPHPGIKPAHTYQRWDEERVVSAILERHRNGEPLASSKVPANLREAARKYCGSWCAAIEIAGFDYNQVRIMRRAWTRKEVIAELRRATREGARNPSGPSISDLVAPIDSPLRALFGDLPRALRAANIDPAIVLRKTPLVHRDDNELIIALRKAIATDQVMSARDFFSNTRLGREAAVRFGGIRAAIERIGPELWPARRNWPAFSAREVIAKLQARHREGRTLAYDPTAREEPRLLRSAVKRFGSWSRAVELAGLASPAKGRRKRKPSGASTT